MKPTRAKKPVSPPAVPQGVPRQIVFGELEKALAEHLGHRMRFQTSQDRVLFEYGHARIEFPRTGTFVLDGRPFYGAKGRKEGDGRVDDYNTYPLNFVFTDAPDWYAQLVAWMVGILSTGRTVECGKGIGVDDFKKDYSVRAKGISYPYYSLVEWIDGVGRAADIGALDLNPDYQRGAVWTEEQQESFVGYWLEGNDIPKVYVQQYESDDHLPKGQKWYKTPAEVIDGQQRLRALYRWFKGEIAAQISDGRRFWFKDTNEVERRGFLIVVHLLDLSRRDRLDFYLRLNRGGTIHTDAEIERVRQLLRREERGGKCPLCRGKKTTIAVDAIEADGTLVNPRPGTPCMVCNGTGDEPPEEV
jgi:hypothetical protein